MNPTCPGCEGPVRETREVEEFHYGIGDEQVLLKAEVDVIHCDRCQYQVTDVRGEAARSEAIVRYLQKQNRELKERVRELERAQRGPTLGPGA